MSHQQDVSMQNSDKENNGEYIVHRSRTANIIAAVICVLLAVLLWCAVMNIQNTKRIPLTVTGNEQYTYSLSATTVSVSGTRAALRGVSEIAVNAENLGEGEYEISTKELKLPAGVRVSSSTKFVLTVRAR